mgnify:CR=1 FL=1
MASYHQLHVTFSCTVIDPDTLLENNMTGQICFTKQEIESLTATLSESELESMKGADCTEYVKEYVSKNMITDENSELYGLVSKVKSCSLPLILPDRIIRPFLYFATARIKSAVAGTLAVEAQTTTNLYLSNTSIQLRISRFFAHVAVILPPAYAPINSDKIFKIRALF